MILVPVKNLVQAKQRLAAVLDQQARTELAQAMLHDVLDALRPLRTRATVALVTSDRFAMDLARHHGFEIIADAANSGETGAIEMASAECVKRGAEWNLVLPADIPLMETWEVERILDAAPAAGSVLVPAGDGRGTNAVLRRPVQLFPLRFGNESFQPHLAAARATGLPCTVIELPGIAVDVDNPAGLRQLMDAPGNCRAQLLARSWKLPHEISAAS